MTTVKKAVSTKTVSTNSVTLTKAQVKKVHTLGDSLLVGEAAGIKADSGYKAINKILEGIEVMWPECRGNGYQSAKDLGIDEVTYKKVLGTLDAICTELANMGVQTAAKNIKQNISRHSVHKIAQAEAAKAKREAAKAESAGEDSAANDEDKYNVNQLAAFIKGNPSHLRTVLLQLTGEAHDQVELAGKQKDANQAKCAVLNDAYGSMQEACEGIASFLKK